MVNIIRTLVYDEQISLTLADTTELVRRGQALHGLRQGGISVLGKLLSASAFMSAALKEESGEISFALQDASGGVLASVSGNYALKVRGYLEDVEADGEEQEILKQAGAFTVVRDDGYSRPFVGSCAIPASPTVDGILEEYYRVSEQLPTFISTVVDFDEQGELAFAGIAVLQPLPFTDEKTVEALPKGEALQEIVRKIRLFGVEKVAKDEFSAKPDGIKGGKATYTCNCSRAYLMQVLTSLGEAQMRAIIREDGAVRVHCHYCNTDYAFDDKDADVIFKK
jgi:molecular chaperone Hsp33